jgi:hypothetical protein
LECRAAEFVANEVQKMLDQVDEEVDTNNEDGVDSGVVRHWLDKDILEEQQPCDSSMATCDSSLRRCLACCTKCLHCNCVSQLAILLSGMCGRPQILVTEIRYKMLCRFAAEEPQELNPLEALALHDLEEQSAALVQDVVDPEILEELPMWQVKRHRSNRDLATSRHIKQRPRTVPWGVAIRPTGTWTL